MRPITPLAFKGIKPINMAGVPGVDWDLVVPTSIYVDESYQRDLGHKSMALIRRMIEGWSWAKFKAPTCVRVGDKLLCIDGQHTATAAASHGGIVAIPVLIVAAASTADQADAFISHAKDKVQATRGQLHHAALAAGDMEALRLQRVLDAAGMKLVLSPKPVLSYRPGESFAIGTVHQILKTRGDKLTKDVLSALVQSGITPISGGDLKTADMLLCEPDISDAFDVERVAAAFRDMTPAQMQEADMLAAAKAMPTWKALGAVLCRTVKMPKSRTSKIGETSPTFTPLAPADAKAEPAFRSVLTRPVPSPSARVIDRRYSGVVPLGEPEPGRSALDERRRLTA